jgi:hypothetical protein
MKLLKIIFNLVSVLSLFNQAACRQGDGVLSGEIDILDVRDSVLSKDFLSGNRPYDVVVCRSYIMGDSYMVRYYQNENDTLRSHQATLKANEDYDRVAYRWLNDTTVTIRLFSTYSEKEETYKVWGYGPRSSIEWPD